MPIWRQRLFSRLTVVLSLALLSGCTTPLISSGFLVRGAQEYCELSPVGKALASNRTTVIGAEIKNAQLELQQYGIKLDVSVDVTCPNE